MNINKATLCGRITKDLELKVLQSETKVLSFGLATNRNWKDQQGTKHEDTCFHNIISFGKTAETIAKYCAKGDELYIEGRIQNRSYDKQDGTKGYVSEIVLESFQFGQKSKNNQQEKMDLGDGIPDEKESEISIGGLDYGEDMKLDDIPF